MQYSKALVEFIDDSSEPEADLSALELEVWNSLNAVLKLSNDLYSKKLDLRDRIKALAPGKGLDPMDGGSRPQASETSRQRLFSFSVCQVSYAKCCGMWLP